MGKIPMFFGEQIRWIAHTGNMRQHNVQQKDGIADSILADVEVAEPLGGHGVSPINATLVVVVKGRRVETVRQTEICHDMAEVLDSFGGGIDGKDFGLTGAATGTGFAVGRPGNGSAGA
jgi:hypothetical protein